MDSCTTGSHDLSSVLLNQPGILIPQATFFLSQIRERFTHLYIKVEKFDAHNALPTSALGGLRDYSHRLNKTFVAIGYIF